MVVRKAKKVTKYRAKTYHGAGHRKKRRGAGSRGGRGMAGSGKRAGQKKAGIGDTLGRPGGKKGFSSHHKSSVGVGVNVSYFTSSVLERLVADKKASKEGDAYAVDLAKIGFGKLIGCGNILSKVNFTAVKVSSKAQEKVSAAGGSVNVAGSA